MVDDEVCYRAVQGRDARFDGWFVTAVRTTGIYCRPSCPATTPRRRNVRFFPTAAAAQHAGFRACRRCRPDATPGSPAWNTRADVVARAMRLIADGVVDRDGVGGLARCLGYSERHLTRLVTAELGAGPLAIARAQRAHTARLLIETTDLPLTQVAFGAGFASVRQFNDTVRAVFAATPSDLRAAARRGGGGPPGAGGGLVVRLPQRQPADTAGTLRFLGERAVPGVEAYDGTTFRRSLRLPHGAATVTLTPAGGHVAATLRLGDLRDLAAAVARCRRLLDLDADPEAIAAHLGPDPLLGPLVRATPGRRLPGSGDGGELAVRAVLGQQVSVAGARTLAGRLVAALGDPLADTDGAVTHLFPTADALAGADLSVLAGPASRRRTLAALAAAVASGSVDLAPGADRAATTAALLAVPGIGAWTAGYTTMRALGDPDVLLGTDLGVRRALQAAGVGDARAAAARSEAWRPWRSYATLHLWAARPGRTTDDRR